MKHILHSKAGVTVLEGVIALGLLALVAAGAFGVLLSASRQDSMPDIREEMSYAVEKANDKLKVYLQASRLGDVGHSYLPESLQQGLCGEDSTDPLSGEHDIKCLLPLVCDKNNHSEFFYTAVQQSSQNGYVKIRRQEGTPNKNNPENGYGTRDYGENYTMSSIGDGYVIRYKIRCNGYEL